MIGGAVNTEALWPGYRVDTCSSFHVLIHLTGIIEELGLARYGLRYQDADPFAFAPFPDGTMLRFFKNVDRTCQEIARISPRDAETYRAFVTLWGQFNEAVFAAFAAPPAPQYMFPAIASASGAICRSSFALAARTRSSRRSCGRMGRSSMNCSRASRCARRWRGSPPNPAPARMRSVAAPS